MTSPNTIILICIGYLVTKHFLGDFVLQTKYQVVHKSHYGHPGGLLHAATHGALTAPLFFLLPNMEGPLFMAILAGEILTHYHIDWSKEQLLQKFGWVPQDQQFWQIFGFDQLLHLMSYLVMAALIVKSL